MGRTGVDFGLTEEVLKFCESEILDDLLEMVRREGAVQEGDAVIGARNIDEGVEEAGIAVI